MKATDLIKGSWYIYEHTTLIAFKFDSLLPSENIKSIEYIKKEGYANNMCAIYRHNIFREVSILDIQQYLPDGHIDKLSTIYQMLDLKPAKLTPLITKDFPEIKLPELNTFPITGWCKSFDIQLISYLRTLYPKNKPIYTEGMIAICWNAICYWTVSTTSNRPEYTLEQLNKFINPNLIQDGKHGNTSSNELQTITSENKRPIIRGTIAVRRRGQQSSIGSRPQGNITSINTSRTKSSSIEICKNIIKYSYT